MALSAANTSRLYRSIPENGDYVSSEGSRRAHVPAGLSRRIAAVLGAGLLATVAAFVVGRQGLVKYRIAPQPIRMVAPPPAALYGPAPWGAPRIDAYLPIPPMPPMQPVSMPPMSRMSQVRPMQPMPLRRRTPAVPTSPYFLPRAAFAPLATSAREDDSDFSLDERVPTYQCSKGLLCRARLIVESQDGAVTIKGGYLIYSRTKSARKVDKRMHRRMKRTTPRRAPKWTRKLLRRVKGRLDEVNCTVTYEQVLDAITKAAYAVLACEKSDQSSCNTLFKIGYCAAPAPTPEPQPVPAPQPTVDYSGLPIDELVPTAQCAENRYCRARLTATETDGVVTVKAGYYVYSIDDVTRTMDDATKSYVSATTPEQARSWAQQLLSGAHGRLGGANCTVSVEQVAAALLQGSQDVLRCTNTDDPACNAMEPVRIC